MLDERVQNLDAGRAGKFLQLLHRIFRLGPWLLRHGNQQPPFLGRPHHGSPLRPFLQGTLQRLDILGEIDLEPADRLRRFDTVRCLRSRRGDEGGDLHQRLPGRHQQGGNQIEAQQGEVGQVIVGERLPLEVGVDEAQAPQQSPAEGVIGKVGDHQFFFISHYDVLDFTEAVDENADLAADLRRHEYHLPRQVHRQCIMYGHAPPVQLFQTAYLARFKPCQVAVQMLDGDFPLK